MPENFETLMVVGLVVVMLLLGGFMLWAWWSTRTPHIDQIAKPDPNIYQENSLKHGPKHGSTQLTPETAWTIDRLESQLKQRYQDKLNQIDQERITALLAELRDLNRELKLADTNLTIERPEIQTVLDPAAAILLMTQKRLAGHSSVRKLEAAFEQHNAAAEAAGQRRLRITQKEIRKTLQEYTSGKDGAIKLIRLSDSGHSKLFFLFYANGRDRYLIPLDDMVESWVTLNRVKNPSTVL